MRKTPTRHVLQGKRLQCRGRRPLFQHLLPIPDYGQPGTYRLTISVHPFGEQKWILARGADGTVLGDEFVLPETVTLEPR
jgi:hypothetical protein